MREEVPGPLAGERLDRVVAMGLECSRARAAELVAGGEVLVNGEPVLQRAHRVVGGDVVECEAVADPGAEPLTPDPSMQVPVVYADDQVIVVDKPAGMVVHPGAGHAAGTLVHGLLAAYPELRHVGEPHRPGIVHRLDRGTSGLLVVARTPEAHTKLTAELAARRVRRVYVALVWGHPDEDDAVVDAPVGRSSRSPTLMSVSARGRPARTAYHVERRYDAPVAVARLRCTLETGRTHQIRVHLSAVGHPVVGDGQYGGARQSLPFGRPALHAVELAFGHPATGRPMAFESPLPPDLANLFAQLH